MSTALAGVLEQALELPEDERGELIDLLCASLEVPKLSSEEQAAVDAAWKAEIARRSKEIDEGKVQLVPWSEVKAKLLRYQGKQV
jgi:putative addiction module component (TIGR02574 family)